MVKRSKNGVDNKLTKKQNNEIKYNINIFKKDYNRFEITFPFNKDILQVCRDIPGRLYNLENKSWTFPIQQYTSLIQKLKFKKDVIIEKDLTAEEIQNIQIVAIGEDEDFIYIQFPKNDELRSMMLKYKSSWNEKKFCWALPKIKKELFYKELVNCNYKVVHYSQPKLGI